MTPQQNQIQGNEKRLRLVRPSIILLCGPAACGKSTFAERRFRPTQVISSDWARARVCDDEKDQRFQAQAFDLVHHLAEIRLSLNRLCVVDSTGLASQFRKEYLELARKFGVPCVALLFDVPLEKCVERDQARQRVVGRPAIERQYQAFEQTKTEKQQEGLTKLSCSATRIRRHFRSRLSLRPFRAVQPIGRPLQGSNRRPRPEQNGARAAVRDVKAPQPSAVVEPAVPAGRASPAGLQAFSLTPGFR